MAEQGDDTRGLSDVLGYVLVFSLVVLAVLLVTAGGLAAVEDARDTEQAQNAERAFDVVADNFAAIYERNAPSRSTELDLGDSEIYYNSNVSLTIRGDGKELTTRRMRPVEMNVVDDRNLIYEGGAVFRNTDDGVTMSRPPPFLLTERRVHLPVVQTTAGALESAGSTTVLLRGVSTGRRTVTSGSENFSQLTIGIASPRFEAWEAYLSDEDGPGLDCTTQPAVETVTCTHDLGTDSVTYVTVQQIRLSLIL